MIFIDTGYLIALADARDQLHHRAVAWTERIAEPVLVTEYVLADVINHFSNPADRPRGAGLLQLIKADSRFTLLWAAESLFNAGLSLHRARADKEWSLTDCISFHVMQERGIRQALAYDIHFEQAGFDALLRRDPPQ